MRWAPRTAPHLPYPRDRRAVQRHCGSRSAGVAIMLADDANIADPIIVDQIRL
jgi:hypothetical protein